MQYASNTYVFLYKLSDLLCANLSLVKAVDILAHVQGVSKNIQKTKKLSLQVLGNLKKGYSFSRSLLLCSDVSISRDNASVLEAAEQASCVKDVLIFLCYTYEKAVQNRKDIQNAIAYPIFIILTAFVGTAFLIYWKDLFLTTISTKTIILVFTQAMSVLVLLFIVLGMYIYSSIKEPSLFKLYYTLGFLQQAGFTFSKSLELHMGNSTRTHLSKTIFYAYNDIRKGTLVSTAFRKYKLADESMAMLLEIGEKSGSIALSCSQIAKNIDKRYEEKKLLCFKLLEPMLLFIVGIYVLILMNGIIVPYISDYGGII